MMTNPNHTFTPWRRIFCSLFLVAAAVAAIGAIAFSDAIGQRVEVPSQGGLRPAAALQKIAPEVLADTSDGRNASVVILLAEQADVSAGYNMRDQEAQGWFVYNTLTQHAARTQIGLRNFLDSRGVAYRSFWAANMLVATADRALVEAVAARPDVARVDSNKPTRWIEDPSIANFGVTPSAPAVVEWGVQNVNAPQVWAMGFTGQGIVVGNQDTGMRWTHNALKPHYRGWDGVNADHNYNWWDAIHSGGGSCSPNHQEPCDDSGHGTHTTGTTTGDDGAGNQVGVAPGAQWIGCRNMDQGNGTPATYTECFQFFIAPTDLNGQNPDPTLRPHVMNNSWGCPVSEGCTTLAELETIVNNTQAAGIFVEVSAGNAGPACSTVNDPPAIYEASFSTGAYDISNTLASFSSRGPSTFYTPNLLKPNISGPGVNVRSSTRTSDTSYGNLSGTSMAGPHVVGVVALLWSARPQLQRDIATTKTILQNTANPNVTVNPPQTCDGIPNTQIPNNSFGYGRVDALAAVNSVPQGTPTPSPTGTPSPTPTPTPTPSSPPLTPTPTPPLSPTPTPTATVTASPTATPRATPRPRPTPHPRP
jgi:serine protease AprX